MPEASVARVPGLGMHAQLDPLAVPEDGYRLGVNVAMDKQALSQRDGIREIPLRSDTDGLVAEFQALNYQGGIKYQPGQGQSALQFASKADYIAIAAGGRKFLVEVVGKGESTYGVLAEITGGLPQPPDLHMNWLAQAENYLISGDDYGKTWVYDGVERATFSDGYDPSNPEQSRIPNKARLPVYSHGRVAIITGARNGKIGDVIHGNGFTDASALLNFIEQVYWASGAEFVVPSEAGAILAAYTLPTLGTTSAHGELIWETEERVVAVRTNVYPRTSWIDTPNMIVTMSAEGGARGPWAYDVYTDDSVRRTLRGIESLTFSRRTSSLVYEPQELISEQIDDLLESDFGPLLRFNQTKVHRKSKRLYSTVRPWVSGYHWKHRGLVSYNYKRKVWEGLNVYPEPVRDIKGLIPVSMSGEQRMFAVAGNDQTSASLRVLEIEPGLRTDVLTDGTHPISSAIYTRAIYGDLDESVTIESGSFQLANVLGTVDWAVFWKSDDVQGCWQEWASGSVCHGETGAGAVKKIDLGVFNGVEKNGVRVNSGRHFEFLIRWSGKAEFRYHRVEHSTGKVLETSIIDETDDCTEDLFCCDNNSDPFILWQP